MRLKNPDDDRAWTEFVDLYTPMLYGFCLRRGLQAADSADLVQDVMKSVASAMEGFDYDREKGRFRSWLFTVAHNRLCQHFRKAGRQPRGSGDTAVIEFLENQPSPEEEHDWEIEYRKRVFDWAAARVKETVAAQTWDAFWKTAVEEQSPADAAEELGMNLGSVYVAKSRIIARMRQEVESITGEDEADIDALGS